MGSANLASPGGDNMMLSRRIAAIALLMGTITGVAGGMQGAFVVSDAAPAGGPATTRAGGSGGGFGY